jgi:hypothetical protein
MIVKTRLAEIQEELSRQFENVTLKGQGASSFLYLFHNGRGIEISEQNGGFWLEFWEKSDDEDSGPVKEMTVARPELAIQETTRWLG